MYPRTPDNILGNLLAAFYKPKHNIPQIQMVLTNSIRKDAYSIENRAKDINNLPKRKYQWAINIGKDIALTFSRCKVFKYY